MLGYLLWLSSEYTYIFKSVILYFMCLFVLFYLFCFTSSPIIQGRAIDPLFEGKELRWDGRCCCDHLWKIQPVTLLKIFKNKEIKIQRDWEPCPKSHSSCSGVASHPGVRISKSVTKVNLDHSQNYLGNS